MLAYRFHYAEAGTDVAQALAQGRTVLVEDTNVFCASKEFEETFEAIAADELDLLRLAAAVFACDRAAARGPREDFGRSIELHLPVYSPELVRQERAIAVLLRRLSQDAWTIRFYAPTAPPPKAVVNAPKKPNGQTLLFSGGLDSLAGAVEFGQSKTTLSLVSHKTRNPVTDGAQQALVAALKKSGLNVAHHQFFVSSRNGGPSGLVHDAENTQRTRSFVFLVLGALCARRTGNAEVLFMAENGQMAIHLPLTTARIGAFSTHTAHPTVLRLAEGFLSAALGFPLTVRNPYVYKTKGEVVAQVANKHPHMVPLSTSCWKNARVQVGGATHCGECVPCLVRRVALELYGADPTPYAFDMFRANLQALDPAHDGFRNINDVAEFRMRFATQGNADLLTDFPELYSQDFDSGQAIDMYKRFAKEAGHVLSKYPTLATLLK